MCGIIGVVGQAGTHVNQLIYDGLTVLQHRGQDAAGISTWDGSKMHLQKELGLVTEAFKQEKSYSHLIGNIGIGHVRYPTAGSGNVSEAQPFYTANPVNITLGHNGTLINSEKIRSELIKTHFCQFNTNSSKRKTLYKLDYRHFILYT